MNNFNYFNSQKFNRQKSYEEIEEEDISTPPRELFKLF